MKRVITFREWEKKRRKEIKINRFLFIVSLPIIFMNFVLFMLMWCFYKFYFSLTGRGDCVISLREAVYLFWGC